MNIYEPIFFCYLLKTIPNRIISLCSSRYNFAYF